MTNSNDNTRVPESILIAGLGSPHGDDQAGWLVLDELKKLPPVQAELRKLWSPHELLDHFEGRSVLHLCDAAEINGETGLIHHWQNSQSLLPATTALSTHGPALGSVLQLLSQLAPEQKMDIHIWTISGQCWETMSEPCEVVRNAAIQVAENIVAEIIRQPSLAPVF
ncbi:MAG: hydrogenase maturation protease [Planctomycetaceae bacterium]|nr:hydrogenase maturation protease [Planctomycetaceae bacterium]